MRTQAYSCVRERLPKNPNFYLFVLLLLSHVVLFSFFPMLFTLPNSLFHVLVFLFAIICLD